MAQDRPLFETEREPVVQRDLCAGEVKLHAHIERHTAQSRIIPGFVTKAMKHDEADAVRVAPEAIVLMPEVKSTANRRFDEVQRAELNRRKGKAEQ